MTTLSRYVGDTTRVFPDIPITVQPGDVADCFPDVPADGWWEAAPDGSNVTVHPDNSEQPPAPAVIVPPVVPTVSIPAPDSTPDPSSPEPSTPAPVPAAQ